MFLKILKLFHDFWPPCMFLPEQKPATIYIILWKVIITSFKISNCFYLVIFHKKISGY